MFRRILRTRPAAARPDFATAPTGPFPWRNPTFVWAVAGCRWFSGDASLGTFGDGVGKPKRSPSEIYRYCCTHGRLKEDAHQASIVAQLDQLYSQLERYNPSAARSSSSQSPPAQEGSGGLFSSMFGSVKQMAPSLSSSPGLHGFYLWGPPGCGKTMLMDLMFRCAPHASKKRTHFNSFMLDVHRRIFKWRQANPGGGDPLPAVASAIASEGWFLCFDEFQVTDVADAMVLRRLFDLCWDKGMVFMMTSNRPPQDLYYNGIQRDLFLPFIDELAVKNVVVELHSGLDYRTLGTNLSNTYFLPSHAEEYERAFETVLDGAVPQPQVLPIPDGRTLTVPAAVDGVARFQFAELCLRNVGAADFQTLSEHFHTVFISDVPMLTLNEVNAVRRFITLIDELYQARIRVVISAAAPAHQIFDTTQTGKFDEVFAFDRCVSRLIEMQSKEYLDRAHAVRARLGLKVE